MTAMTGTYYPEMPSWEDGEGSASYTNRVLGCGGNPSPYNHNRNRQCSIGFHSECSQRADHPKLGGRTTLGATGRCQCPHHTDHRLEAAFLHVRPYLTHLTGEDNRSFSAAIDVLIDAMADMDAPLRRLAQSWRENGGLIEAQCADALTEILEGKGKP